MFPIVLEVLRGIAHVHYAARRFDDAIEWSQKLLDLDPNYAAVAVVLQWAYEAQGLYDKALDARLKGSLAAGDTPERIAAARRVYAQGGWRGYWRYVLKEGYRPDFVPRRSYQFAEIHVKVGERRGVSTSAAGVRGTQRLSASAPHARHLGRPAARSAI